LAKIINSWQFARGNKLQAARDKKKAASFKLQASRDNTSAGVLFFTAKPPGCKNAKRSFAVVFL
jgi:hypothetical protein